MSFTAVINGQGNFTASVNGSAAFNVSVPDSPTLNVGMAVIGPSGLLTADAPLIYDGTLKHLSIEPDYYALKVHTHQISDVIGLQQALDGLQPSGDYATNAYVNATFQPIAGMSAYYLASNPAGYITTADLSGYATESWVTSQGYITSAALSPYLLSTTAASTYQLIGDYATNTDLTNGLALKANVSHTHDASAIVSGVIDLARIPIIPSQVQVVSTQNSIANLTVSEQAQITGAGVLVTTTDGNRWVYSGSGSKTSESSYVRVADITPDWTEISNKPAFGSMSLEATTDWLSKAGNLSGLTNLATARTNLGLGTMATQSASSYYLASNPSGYITSSALNGYATESWVTSQGYLTAPYNPFDQTLNTTDYVYFGGLNISDPTSGVAITPVGITTLEFGFGSPVRVQITTTGITFPDGTSQTTAATGATASQVASLFGAASQSGSYATFNPPLTGQYLYYDGTYLNWGAAPNPFDQSLNTTDSVNFGGVISSGGITVLGATAPVNLSPTGLELFSAGTSITFSDASVQTTAFPPAGGTTAQYIDGTGALQTFPATGSAENLETTVYNNSGATIPKHSVIYINGGHGNDPTIALAQANQESTSRGTFGFTTADIPDQSIGTVLQVGKLTDASTHPYPEGTLIFLSPLVAGGWTTVQPYSPNHYVALGTITRSHPTQGTIQVRIINSNELNELSDVQVTTAVAGDLLSINSGGYWVPVSPSSFGFATTESPAFTGVPTAPTPASNDNDTSIATTAFVNAYCPSASTTVQGKVELATDDEVIAGQSTTTVPTTNGALMAAEYGYLKRKFFDFITTISTQSTGTGYAYSQLPAYQNVVGAANVAGFTRAYSVLFHSSPKFRTYLTFFNGKFGFGQGMYLVNSTATTGFTLVSRIGITNAPTAGVALPADDTTTKHFGWKYVVGSSVKLQVFDGTAYQETDTGYTPAAGGPQPVYIVCWSDGVGTAYIEITKPDGSIVTASRTGCPTGSATSATSQSWVLQVAGTGTQTAAWNLTATPVMFSADW